MSQTAETRRTPIGPVLAIAGGALLFIGSFLTWVTVDVAGQGISDSGTGIDVDDGWITLVIGVGLAVVGIAALRRPRRALAVLAIVGGIAATALSVWEIVTVESRALDAFAEELAPQFGVPVDAFRAALDVAVDQGEVSISGGIGLYLVIAGGVVAIAGGALQVGGARAAAPGMPTVTSPAESFAAPGREDLAPPASTVSPPAATPAPGAQPPEAPSA